MDPGYASILVGLNLVIWILCLTCQGRLGRSLLACSCQRRSVLRIRCPSWRRPLTAPTHADSALRLIGWLRNPSLRSRLAPSFLPTITVALRLHIRPSALAICARSAMVTVWGLLWVHQVRHDYQPNRYAGASFMRNRIQDTLIGIALPIAAGLLNVGYTKACWLRFSFPPFHYLWAVSQSTTLFNDFSSSQPHAYRQSMVHFGMYRASTFGQSIPSAALVSASERMEAFLSTLR